MSTNAVRAILEGRLATWAAGQSPALRVAFENVPFTPASGETYLAAYTLPADTRSQDLKGDHRAYVGVFQVSVVAPKGAGSGGALAIANNLNSLFPVNGRYTASGFTVQVMSPASAAQGIPSDNSYTVPVSFRYRADTI